MILSELKPIIDWFTRFPGIGERTSEKLVMHLIQHFSPKDLEKFADEIVKLSSFKKCQKCHMLTASTICENCEKHQNSSTLIIVENYFDCLRVMQSGCLEGLFHLTGGLIDFARGIDPQMLYLNDILERLSNIDEVIIATNATIEGEITANYIKEIISKKFPNIKISRIAYGIPVGSDFKYSDSETIKRAIANRINMKK